MTDYFRDLADGRWARSQTGSPPRQQPFDARAAVAATMARAMARAAEERQQEETERAAYHESGHCYALWAQGYPFAEASIDDTGHGQTARTGEGPAWTRDAAAIVLAAGAAGERLAYPDAPDGCQEDDDLLDEILEDQAGADDEAQFRARCEELIEEGREAVAAVARILLIRGHISGESAAAVFGEYSERRARPRTRQTVTRPGPREGRGEPNIGRGAVLERAVSFTQATGRRHQIPGAIHHKHWVEYPEDAATAAALGRTVETIHVQNEMYRADDRGDDTAFRRHQDQLLALTAAARRAA